MRAIAGITELIMFDLTVLYYVGSDRSVVPDLINCAMKNPSHPHRSKSASATKSPLDRK
jgi:hypothetical protein